MTGADQLRSLVSGRKAGDPVVVGYSRDGKRASVTITTVAAPDASKRPIVGAQLGTRTDFPVKVDIKLRDVGGPSAGLMFALGIIDKLGDESLTGGRNIAGTGEITASGQVGPIGGIQQKMVGARDAGATVFLTPSGNCADAMGAVPAGLKVVKVSTLSQAVSDLEAIKAGKPVPSC